MRELVCRPFAVGAGGPLFYKELAGGSSETKPTAGIIDGSTFRETDTGKLWYFNEKSSAWVDPSNPSSNP